MTEQEYLASIGQSAPSGVTYESPGDYIDPAERNVIFPSGVPAAKRSGGLGLLAKYSQYADLLGLGTRGAKAAVDGVTGAGQKQLDEAPVQSSVGQTTPGPHAQTFFTQDPRAMAEGERAQRQTAASSSLANSAGKIVKILASMGAGAAAGGGAGGATAGYTGSADGAGFSGIAGGGTAGAAGGAAEGSLTGAAAGGAGGAGGGTFSNLLSKYNQYTGNGGSGGGGIGGMMGGGGGGGGMGGMMGGMMGGGQDRQGKLARYLGGVLGGMDAKRAAALMEAQGGGLETTYGVPWAG